MCQIQIIQKSGKKLNEYDINELYTLMKLGSIDNDDAFGVFTKGYSIKNSGLFSTENIDKSMLKKSCFAVGHNRYATAGNCKDNNNNHPFHIERFTLVHNGIISNVDALKKEYNIDDSKIKTDSYVILWLINKFFSEKSDTDYFKKITEAIQNTTKLLEGYYSIVLYDSEEEYLFYFKDFRPNFCFAKIDDVLIGSTKEINLNLVYDGKKKDIIHPKSDTIYWIYDGKLKEIGKFEEKKIVTEKSNAITSFDSGGWGTEWEDTGLTKVYIPTDEEIVYNTFIDSIGYAPEFKIDGNNIILKDNGITDSLNYFCPDYKINNGNIVIDIDSFTNSNYINK